MKKLNHTAVIASGFQGLLCAGISTAITALFSWSFVASTDSLDWMGSGRMQGTEIALSVDPTRRDARS